MQYQLDTLFLDDNYFVSAGYDGIQKARASRIKDGILVSEKEDVSEENGIKMLFLTEGTDMAILSTSPVGNDRAFHLLFEPFGDGASMFSRSFTGQSTFSDLPSIELEAAILPSSLVDSPETSSMELADAIYTRVVPGEKAKKGVRAKGMKGVVQSLLGKRAEVRWEDERTKLELVVNVIDDETKRPREDHWRRLAIPLGVDEYGGSQHIVFARKPEKPSKGSKKKEESTKAHPVGNILPGPSGV